MKRIINSLIFALFSLPVLAQDSDNETERWYEVEIILFEQLNPVSTGSELWPMDIEQPDLSNAIDLLRSPEEVQTSALAEPIDQTIAVIEPIQPSETDIQQSKPGEANNPYLDTPYLILPKQQYQLSDAYQKLVNSEDYLPLVHVAWRQVIPPREQPDRIFIHDKLNGTTEQEVLRQEQDAPPASTDFLAEAIADDRSATNDVPEHSLSGIISLGLGRYIHVEADLLLHKPLLENLILDEHAPPAFSLPEPTQFIFDGFENEPVAVVVEKQMPELFRIQGNLRMPSKKIHYLDHPLVGMLILFTPYELPESEPEPGPIEEVEDTSTVPAEITNKGTVVRPGQVLEDRSF